jgi:hypothetical protein
MKPHKMIAGVTRLGAPAGPSRRKFAILFGVSILLPTSFGHALAQRATPMTQQKYHTHYPSQAHIPGTTKVVAATPKPSLPR